ncbi:hypothetical protein [Roseibacillus persicicus]|uniref:Uncharacterized protein n=1 Tax=Roseibacillus persicicus TaxID=454148 RepID=A0A918TFB9_9BACT|nr:hypothetical protein [Roseibacillus persicicus]GHC43890.1 hypothetical protein GCM10007100_06350 [Roseibacillus persicicus]
MENDTQPSAPKGDHEAKKSFERGLIACFVVAVLCALRIIFVYSNFINVAVWLAASVYFFTAPAALRKGIENRRILVGLFAVLLAFLSFRGIFALTSPETLPYGIITTATFLSCLPLILIFGYNQKVTAYIKTLGSATSQPAN